MNAGRKATASGTIMFDGEPALSGVWRDGRMRHVTEGYIDIIN